MQDRRVYPFLHALVRVFFNGIVVPKYFKSVARQYMSICPCENLLSSRIELQLTNGPAPFQNLTTGPGLQTFVTFFMKPWRSPWQLMVT